MSSIVLSEIEAASRQRSVTAQAAEAMSACVQRSVQGSRRHRGDRTQHVERGDRLPEGRDVHAAGRGAHE